MKAITRLRSIVRLCIPILLVMSCFGKVGLAKEITLTYVAPPGEGEIIQEAIDVFERANPGVKIKVQEFPWDQYPTKLATMVASGVPVDVLYNQSAMFGDLYSRGILQPLDQFIEKDKDFSLSDFFRPMLETMKVEGKLYGLPRGNQVQVLYYNTARFDEAGLVPPDKNWRWNQEFLQSCRRLVKDTNGDGKIDTFSFFVPGPGDSLAIWPVVWSNGASFLDASGKQYALDSPEGVASVQFWADLVNVHKVAVLSGQIPGSRSELFSGGKVAMYMSDHVFTWELAQVGFLDYDVAPLPLGTRGRATTINGAAYSMPAGCKHPKEAWEFIKVLVDKDILTKLVVTTKRILPTRSSVAREFLKMPPPPRNRGVFIEALTSYARCPVVGLEKWPLLWQQLNSALGPVLAGSESAGTALRKIREPINEILKR